MTIRDLRDMFAHGCRNEFNRFVVVNDGFGFNNPSGTLDRL
jgi:hypothetical protein